MTKTDATMHTPGPWESVQEKPWKSFAIGLIAAAPELLRVLLRCREYVERAASRWEDDAKASLEDLDAVLHAVDPVRYYQ